MKRARNYKSYIKSPTLTASDIPRQTTSSNNTKRFRQSKNSQPKALQFLPDADRSIDEGEATDHFEETTDNVKNPGEYESDFQSSEDSDNSSSDNETDFSGTTDYINEKLFENSKISLDESALLIYSFVLRHKVSKAGLSDLLDLIQAHMPQESKIPSTRFLLLKSLNFDYTSASTELYCPTCKEYLDQSTSRCDKCDLTFSKKQLTQDGSFFIAFDAGRTISQCLKFSEIQKNLHHNLIKRSSEIPPDEIRSIFDGVCYKKLQLRSNDFTCAVNSDGVPVFKSSKISMWPILCTINELDFRLTRKYVLCLGIWFGSEKPNFNCFLKPFVTMATKLAIDGLTWNYNEIQMNSKVYFPLVVADSVARPLLQGIQQFNGAYGCTWCLSKGESLKSDLNPKSHKWIYPPDEKGKIQLRNSGQFMGHLKELESLLSKKTCKSHFGVKSASRLLLIPKFCIVNGFTFDYMHTALLGITRTLTNAWMDSKNHTEPFYIGKKIKRIDEALSRCLVPYNFDRSVRSITNRAFWKANEWRTWAYISYFVLRDILENDYLVHFSKFVRALMILCSELITNEEIDLAEDLLFSFVKETETLYGLSYCSYNMHLLLHASQNVRNWGPLPLYSAFNFENFNGVLLNLFKGAYKVPIQISNRVQEIMQLPEMCEVTFKSEIAKIIGGNMRGRKSKPLPNGNNISLLGKPRLQILTAKERNQILQLGNVDCECNAFSAYKACLINLNVYNIDAKTTSKRCNSVVGIQGSPGQFYIIRNIIALSNEQMFVVLSKVKINQCASMPNCYDVLKVKLKTMIFPIEQIECTKFIVIRNEDSSSLISIVKIPNTFEIE